MNGKEKAGELVSPEEGSLEVLDVLLFGAEVLRQVFN